MKKIFVLLIAVSLIAANVDVPIHSVQEGTESLNAAQLLKYCELQADFWQRMITLVQDAIDEGQKLTQMEAAAEITAATRDDMISYLETKVALEITNAPLPQVILDAEAADLLNRRLYLASQLIETFSILDVNPTDSLLTLSEIQARLERVSVADLQALDGDSSNDLTLVELETFITTNG